MEGGEEGLLTSVIGIVEQNGGEGGWGGWGLGINVGRGPGGRVALAVVAVYGAGTNHSTERWRCRDIVENEDWGEEGVW